MSDFKNLTHGFSALSVLVLDANIAAAQNTRMMLGVLGVANVEIVRKAEEALAFLQEKKVDIALLEWAMKPVSGAELTKKIRHLEGSQNPTLPILMLSGDTSPEVQAEAVRVGVNALAQRPLSPQSLAAHLHEIVYQPKTFILSPAYRGPDRRSLELSNHPDEKRIQLLPPAINRAELSLYSNEQGVKLVLPDYSLRLKANLAAMEQGLVSMQAIEQEFLDEGMNDVARISALFSQIETAVGSRAPIERMCSNTSLVQARAEAYDYTLCAKVAGYLSDFCRHYFNVHNPNHRLVLEKHIQALQVVLNKNIKGEGGKGGAELANELSKLVFKFV